MILAGCIEGPTGPAGENGAAKFQVFNGTLTFNAMNSEHTWWDVSGFFTQFNQWCLVDVKVRKGEGFMWETPTYHISYDQEYVRIMDRNPSLLGYQYYMRVACDAAGKDI